MDSNSRKSDGINDVESPKSDDVSCNTNFDVSQSDSNNIVIPDHVIARTMDCSSLDDTDTQATNTLQFLKHKTEESDKMDKSSGNFVEKKDELICEDSKDFSKSNSPNCASDDSELLHQGTLSCETITERENTSEPVSVLNAEAKKMCKGDSNALHSNVLSCLGHNENLSETEKTLNVRSGSGNSLSIDTERDESVIFSEENIETEKEKCSYSSGDSELDQNQETSFDNIHKKPEKGDVLKPVEESTLSNNKTDPGVIHSCYSIIEEAAEDLNHDIKDLNDVVTSQVVFDGASILTKSVKDVSSAGTLRDEMNDGVVGNVQKNLDSNYDILNKKDSNNQAEGYSHSAFQNNEDSTMKDFQDYSDFDIDSSECIRTQNVPDISDGLVDTFEEARDTQTSSELEQIKNYDSSDTSALMKLAELACKTTDAVSSPKEQISLENHPDSSQNNEENMEENDSLISTEKVNDCTIVEENEILFPVPSNENEADSNSETLHNVQNNCFNDERESYSVINSSSSPRNNEDKMENINSNYELVNVDDIQSSSAYSDSDNVSQKNSEENVDASSELHSSPPASDESINLHMSDTSSEKPFSLNEDQVKNAENLIKTESNNKTETVCAEISKKQNDLNRADSEYDAGNNIKVGSSKNEERDQETTINQVEFSLKSNKSFEPGCSNNSLESKNNEISNKSDNAVLEYKESNNNRSETSNETGDSKTLSNRTEEENEHPQRTTDKLGDIELSDKGERTAEVPFSTELSQNKDGSLDVLSFTNRSEIHRSECLSEKSDNPAICKHIDSEPTNVDRELEVYDPDDTEKVTEANVSLQEISDNLSPTKILSERPKILNVEKTEESEGTGKSLSKHIKEETNECKDSEMNFPKSLVHDSSLERDNEGLIPGTKENNDELSMDADSLGVEDTSNCEKNFSVRNELQVEGRIRNSNLSRTISNLSFKALEDQETEGKKYRKDDPNSVQASTAATDNEIVRITNTGPCMETPKIFVRKDLETKVFEDEREDSMNNHMSKPLEKLYSNKRSRTHDEDLPPSKKFHRVSSEPNNMFYKSEESDIDDDGKLIIDESGEHTASVNKRSKVFENFHQPNVSKKRKKIGTYNKLNKNETSKNSVPKSNQINKDLPEDNGRSTLANASNLKWDIEVVDLVDNDASSEKSHSEHSCITENSKNFICDKCKDIWNDDTLKLLFEGYESVTVNSRITYGAIICMNVYVSIHYPAIKEQALKGLLDRADLAKNLGSIKVSILNTWLVALIKNKKISCCDPFRPIYRIKSPEKRKLQQQLENGQKIQKPSTSNASKKNDLCSKLGADVKDKEREHKSNIQEIVIDDESETNELTTQQQQRNSSSENNSENNIDSEVETNSHTSQASNRFPKGLTTNGRVLNREFPKLGLIAVTIVQKEKDSLSPNLHEMFDNLIFEIRMTEDTKNLKRSSILNKEILNIHSLYILIPSNIDLDSYFKFFVQILHHRDMICLIPNGKMLVQHVEFLRRENNRHKLGTTKNKSFLYQSWDSESLYSISLKRQKKYEEYPTIRDILGVFCSWKNNKLLHNKSGVTDLKAEIHRLFNNISIPDCFGLCIKLYAIYCRHLAADQKKYENSRTKLFLDLFYLPRKEADSMQNVMTVDPNLSFLPPGTLETSTVISYLEEQIKEEKIQQIKRSFPETLIDRKLQEAKKLRNSLVNNVKPSKAGLLLDKYAKLKNEVDYLETVSDDLSTPVSKAAINYTPEMKLMVAKLRAANVPVEYIPSVIEKVFKNILKRKVPSMTM